MKESCSLDDCQCAGIEARFDSLYVAKKLNKYRESGPKKTTQVLIDALKSQGIQGKTLLDIGGGIGDVVHALLEAGVEEGTNVEASTAYAEAFEQEATRLGHADKVQIYMEDFVEIALEIPKADIVTLDRVVCCYHDFHELVGRSVEKARQYYGLVYPLDRWWVKAIVAIYYNLRFWLQKNPFRTFVHPEVEVDSLIKKQGLERVFFDRLGSWQVVVYART